MNDALKKAQKKASSPEARAKAVATMKRKREEREAAAFTNAEKAAKLEDKKNRIRNHPANKAALLKHAKITKKKGRPKKVQSIPLDMPRKKYKKAKPGTSMGASKRDVVLALLKYLNEE
jgi:ABC-type nitrate/sulfonate/bicarbonate transport system substrate-binding protein